GGAPSQGGIWTTPDESVRPAHSFVSGVAPSGPGQVVINNGAARKAGLGTGDHAKVVLANSAVVEVTISGVYRTETETGGYVGVLFSKQQALQLLTDGSHLSALDVAADRGVSEQTLTADIAKILPPDLEAQTGDQVRRDDQQG